MSNRRDGATVICTVPTGSRIYPWPGGLMVAPPNAQPYAVDHNGKRIDLDAAEQAKAIELAAEQAG